MFSYEIPVHDLGLGHATPPPLDELTQPPRGRIPPIGTPGREPADARVELAHARLAGRWTIRTRPAPVSADRPRSGGASAFTRAAAAVDSRTCSSSHASQRLTALVLGRAARPSRRAAAPSPGAASSPTCSGAPSGRSETSSGLPHIVHPDPSSCVIEDGVRPYSTRECTGFEKGASSLYHDAP